MDKIKWIEQIIDKWTNLPSDKKIWYLISINLIILVIVIYGGYIHYENKITELENKLTRKENECTIANNRIIARYDALLNNERENTKALYNSHIKYIEKSEKEYKDILFYTKKYRNK